MLGTADLQNAMAALLGADTATLAEATPFVEVALVMEPFTPSPQLVLGDLVLSDFVTSTPLHAASAATQVSVDPATGAAILQVREPAGGWYWAVTAGTNLPQTVYGIALLDAAGAVLLGTELLDEPVLLSAIGQSFTLGRVRFTIPFASLQ